MYLKTNEPIVMRIGTSGLPDKGIKRPTLGVRRSRVMATVTPPTAKRWLSVVRCVRQQSVYFVKYFITNNTKSSQRNDNTVAKHTQKYTDT